MRTYIKDARWGKFILIRGDMICNHVDMYGEWSETEVDLFRLMVPIDGNCIEVGSNIGTHAVPIATFCSQGKIFCYEPQRPVFHVLCGNLAINNRLNVTARNGAVGRGAGHIDIEVSDYDRSWNYGAFSISHGFSAEQHYDATTRKETIEVIALDDDPALASLEQLDLIKIDAEGSEPDVLYGARRLIARHKPNVFIEANSESVVSLLIEEMRRHDYLGYWFVSRRFRTDNYNGLQYPVNGTDSNIIFVPRGRSLPGQALQPVVDFGDLARGVPILDSYC